MGVLMVALMTFKGQEGFVRKDDKFEVGRKQRADDLIQNKLAKVYEEEEEKKEEKSFSLEEVLKGLTSHAKVDEFAAANNLVIPGKEEAKFEERKQFIAQLIENNSHRENDKQ